MNPGAPVVPAGNPRRRALRVLQAIVTIALLAWLVLEVDRDVLTQLGSVSPAVFLLCAALFSTSQLWGAWRLTVFLDGAVRLVEATRLTLQGYFLGNFLPGTIGGDVYRGVVLARSGIPTSRVISTLVADRTVNIATAFALLLICLPFSVLVDMASVRTQALAIAAGCALGALLLVAAAWRAPQGASRPPFRQIARFGSELRALATRPGAVTAGTALSLASLGAALGSQWVLARHLGIDIDFADLSAAVLVVFFVTLLPVSLNGLGVQEAGLTYLMRAMGASLEQAVAFALLSRALILSVSLLGGLAMLGGRPAPERGATRHPEG